MPHRDWTSILRERSGYEPLSRPQTTATFTMKDPETIKQMTLFLVRYGRSKAPNWKERLKIDQPIYHLEVVANSRCLNGSFVIATAQVQRVS